LIDSEIKEVIDRNYKKAEDILKKNIDKLHIMAEALIKYETLDTHQIDDIMEGRTPRPPSEWGDDDGESPSGTIGKKTKRKTKKSAGKDKSDAPGKDSDDPSVVDPANPA
jgi:cell division protease FtsH